MRAEVDDGAVNHQGPAFNRRVMGENPTKLNNSEITEDPPLNQAIALIRSLGIKKLRVLHSDEDLLKALANTNVEVNIGIPDEGLRDFALSSNHASQWVEKIKLHTSYLKIRYITVGSKGIMGEEPGRLLVLPAMLNIQNALHSFDMGSIQVSTSICMDVIGKFTMPSDARFLDNWTPFVSPIVEFLAENASAIMVNVFLHVMNETRDGTADSRLHHGTNSFDAAVDALYWAMKKIGYPSVPIVASSTGWPSTGDQLVANTTIDALTYNKILMKRLAGRRGTLRNPKRPIDAYIFTLFNSKRDRKDELEWGLFDFNMRLMDRQGFSS